MAILPEGGGNGGGGAAGLPYEILFQNQDLQVIGGTRTVPAMTVLARETTYGISYGFTIPLSEWNKSGPAASAGLYATWIQALAIDQYVIGLDYVQVPSAGGDLIDSMEIIVGTDDGRLSASLTVPLKAMNNVQTFQRIADLYEHLIATSGGTP